MSSQIPESKIRQLPRLSSRRKRQPEDEPEKGGLYARPYYIPFLVLALLAAGFGLSLLFQEQSPVIAGLEPRVGNPGEVMVIDGNYFGKDQNIGWVSIDNQRVTNSSILEWTPQRISLRIPEEVRSGSVIVQTALGRSKALSFTSQNQIPRITQSVHSNINAFIDGFEPAACYNGDPVLLKGRNFGHSSGSLVILVDGKPLGEADIFSWNNSEIGFWVPMYASAGAVKLQNQIGVSNTLSINLRKSTASVVNAGDERAYHLELFYGLKDIKRGSIPNWGSLTGYMPLPPQMLEQTIEGQKASGADAVSESAGMLSFSLLNPDPDLAYRLSAQWIVRRQGIRLTVTADPDLNYDGYRDLQNRFAVPSPLVPSSEASIKSFAQAAVGAELRPLARARLLFQSVVDTLRFDPEAGLAFAPEALADRSANSFGYANLLTGALRSQGIPARLIEGVVVLSGTVSQSHYWTEFFIPGVGWVQADPAMADGDAKPAAPAGVDPKTWYFGNIDNRHIVLIRGEGLTSLTRMDANIQKLFQRFVLMQVHAESGGNIESYGLFIDSPEVR